jgi:hypothetical protein
MFWKQRSAYTEIEIEPHILNPVTGNAQRAFLRTVRGDTSSRIHIFDKGFFHS